MAKLAAEDQVGPEITDRRAGGNQAASARPRGPDGGRQAKRRAGRTWAVKGQPPARPRTAERAKHPDGHPQSRRDLRQQPSSRPPGCAPEGQPHPRRGANG
eukprot:15442261-Alexandrium_andersonii.AAC.1